MERSDTASSVSSQDGLEWATCLTLLPSILVVLFLPAYIYHNMRRLIYSQRSSSSIFKTVIRLNADFQNAANVSVGNRRCAYCDGSASLFFV